ncbi:MAG: hypothetical protein ABSA96_16655 [Candidatus Acidiferrales bacterium]
MRGNSLTDSPSKSRIVVGSDHSWSSAKEMIEKYLEGAVSCKITEMDPPREYKT